MKIFEQFPQYEDGFIVLRRFVQEDAKYLSEVYEERLTKRQAEKTIENYEKSYQDKDEVILGIFGKEDEQLKGIIEIYDIHESELSIGYMIVEKYRHQTYAKNSVYLLTKKLVEDYGVTCIHANCHVDNIYSIRVLEHNGYERLGQEEDEYVYAYKPKQLEQDIFNQDEKIIVLAGGCFWGVEKAFKALDGVLETTVGYANGNTDNPTYEEVCRNETGYKEAVKVVYQPNVVSLSTIIRAFFLCIDPRQRNRQGNDIGSQYQAGIYYVDEKDLDAIKPVYTSERMKYDRFFVELEPLKNFYTAEEYHQDYLDKHPNGYCHITAFEMEEVKKLKPQVVENYRERLLANVNSVKADIDFKEEDILKEILLFSDRVDITEEVSRLESHFKQLEYEFNVDKDSQGKKIEFIFQEIFREFNTMGVKSNMYEISKLVVEGKNELEKMREQIMNIE